MVSYALKYLKKKLGRIRNEQVVTKLPDVSPEDLIKYIESTITKDNAQLRAAELKRRVQQEDSKKIEKKRIKEEEEQIREILRQKELRQAYENKHVLKLYFCNHHGSKIRLPTFFTKSNSAFFEMSGLVLKEFDNGGVVWYPLLKDKKEQDVMFMEGSPNPMDIFKSKSHIVSQIYGGKVDSNCDITSEGKPILIDPHMFSEEKTGQKIKVMDISEQSKNKYEQMIQQMSDDNSQLQYEIEKLKKNEVKYEANLAESNMTASVAQETSDIYSAKFANLFQRTASVVSELTNTIASIQDVKQEQVLTERMNQALHRSVRELRDKLEELQPMDAQEIASARTRDIMNDGLALIEKAKMVNAPIVIKSTSGEVMETGKKKKESKETEVIASEDLPNEN